MCHLTYFHTYIIIMSLTKRLHFCSVNSITLVSVSATSYKRNTITYYKTWQRDLFLGNKSCFIKPLKVGLYLHIYTAAQSKETQQEMARSCKLRIMKPFKGFTSVYNQAPSCFIAQMYYTALYVLYSVQILEVLV